MESNVENAASRRAIVSVLCSVLVGIISGCGDGRAPAYPVQGEIRFKDGFPVQIGRIELRCQKSGLNARGEIRAGKFSLTTYKRGDGAIAGTHDCVVVQFVMRESIQGHDTGSLGVVPPKYASYRSSGLSCVVHESTENSIVLEIDSLSEDHATQAQMHKPIGKVETDSPSSK